jgi:hypothetical protein
LNPLGDGQHSVARTTMLHLLPGALIVAFYIVAAPVVRYLGFPSLMHHGAVASGTSRSQPQLAHLKPHISIMRAASPHPYRASSELRIS